MKETIGGGVSSLFLLFLLFLGLQLGHVIEWSWWYVAMPLWIPVAIVLVGFSLFCGLGIIVGTVKAITEGNK